MDYEEDESTNVYAIGAQIVVALCILTGVGILLMGAWVLIDMAGL